MVVPVISDQTVCVCFEHVRFSHLYFQASCLWQPCESFSNGRFLISASLLFASVDSRHFMNEEVLTQLKLSHWATQTVFHYSGVAIVSTLNPVSVRQSGDLGRALAGCRLQMKRETGGWQDEGCVCVCSCVSVSHTDCYPWTSWPPVTLIPCPRGSHKQQLCLVK